MTNNQYRIEQIQEIIHARFLNKKVYPSKVDHLLTDSRRILTASNSLFFAFKGIRKDGHEFIQKAYAKGVRNFVITQATDPSFFPESNFLLVKNAYQAIHALARFHRQQFDFPIIGITGSNGKTIIKEWLFQLLHHQFNIVRSPRSYNSQLGVPLSVWQINQQHQLGIFEAGISKLGEMEKVSPIIQCEIGIFTNIGSAHDEGFLDRKTKIREKLRLFENAKTLIYCKDQKAVEDEILKLKNIELLTWSRHEKASLEIKRIEKANKNTTIHATYKNKTTHISIPFQDEAAIENAIHCWLTLLHLELSDTEIQAKMLRLTPVEMRLESRKGIDNCLIINDSYNSDLTALSMALDFLDQQSTHSKHSIILSDILQSGTTSKSLYQEVARRIAEKKIHQFIGIGTSISTIAPYLDNTIKSHFFKNTTHFLEQIETLNFHSEAILLKGARSFQFERIANRLSDRIHQTVLEVNINAFLYNLNVFASYLKPNTKTMVMVKAAAYGSGSIEIARLLEFQNIDYLAVAYADEGVELRKAGIKSPILVLNPEENTFDAHFQYNLEPEIYSIALLKRFIRYIPDNQTISIHLKIETGMNRLGFDISDLPLLIDIIRAQPQLKIQSIFSHLSASEAPQHDEFTLLQIQRFSAAYETICQQIGYSPTKHILNTSGVIRFPQYQFDMVRLGVGLYGSDNGKQIQHQLQVVNTLKAHISQIKNVSKSESIGYARKGRLQRDSRIAVVSIGYSDGLPRSVGNGRYSLLINNQPAPIIGNICMDMCMVDVTDIPSAQEFDEVIVFGKNPHIDELAKVAGSIPLEILTGITQRVKRIYTQD